MRKVIAATYMTLDGVIEHPERWSFDYWTDESQRYASEQLFASDALLMGRRTYEGFAKAWPNMEATEGEFAVRMNTMPKYVVSSTLDKAEWTNSTVLRGDLVEEVTRLKQEPGRDILMYGYGPVAHTLLRHGLLDELRVWLHPVIAGSGEVADLFYRDGTKVGLRLVPEETKTLSSGVVILYYRPAAR
jgi:dihydrofolate reductase